MQEINAWVTEMGFLIWPQLMDRQQFKEFTEKNQNKTKTDQKTKLHKQKIQTRSLDPGSAFVQGF